MAWEVARTATTAPGNRQAPMARRGVARAAVVQRERDGGEGEETRLFVWVECGPDAARSERTRRLFVDFPDRVPRHPSSGRHATARAALEALCPLLPTYLDRAERAGLHGDRRAVTKLWVPARAGLPLSRRAPSRAGDAPGSDPLQVRAVLVAGATYPLLPLAAPFVRLAHAAAGFGASPALGWLGQLSRLALDLWLRGDALPTLVSPTGDPYRLEAGWLPILDDPGVRACVERLAGAMPLELVALSEPGSWRRDPDRSWRATVTILTAFVDGLARFPPGRGGRARRLQPAARTWRRAAVQRDAWVQTARALRSVPPDSLVRTGAFAGLDLRLATWSQPARRALEARYLALRLVLVPPPALRAAADEAAPAAEDPAGTFSEGVAVAAPAPTSAATGWTIRPRLRSAQGEGAEVTPADLSASGAAARATARRLGYSPAELQGSLAAGLRRAAEHLPPLRAALARDPRPAEIPLTATETMRLLREWGPRLRRRGVELELPEWLERAAMRLRVRLVRARRPPGPAIGHLGLTALTDLTAVAEVAGRPLSVADARAIVAHGEGLVPLGDAAVEVDREDLRLLSRLLEIWQRTGVGTHLRLADALALAAEERAGAEAADGDAGEARERDGDALAGFTYLDRLMAAMPSGRPALEGLPEPPLTASAAAAWLRPYQREGVRWLWSLAEHGLGALLADDMGLGKTLETLALLEARRAAGVFGPRPPVAAASAPPAADPAPAPLPPDDGPLPSLLVCPTSVLTNWQREAAKFAPGVRTHVHHGGGRARTPEELVAASAGADLVITSYALLARDRAALAALPWDGVILDEAQAVKNPATQASRAARSLRSRHRVALTGTPVENRLEELWAIFHFLNPGYLGGPEAFRRRFAVPVQVERDLERARVLHRLVAPFILRRVKSDASIIRDLPPKVEITERCNLTREQARLYQAIVARLEAEVVVADGMRRRALIAVAMLRLKQVLNHPAQFLGEEGAFAPERSGKAARILELVEEALAEGDRLLLFTQFTAFGEGMRPVLSALCGEEVAFLRGATSRDGRDAMVRRFQAGEGSPILLLSLRAGGLGLNLTGANRVIHMDRWWNPAVESQATDRAYRIGQTERVIVHKMVTAGTLEERIDAMLVEKAELARLVVGGGERWLTELADDALFELLALGQDAVEA